MKTKVCTQCNQEKILKDFNLEPRAKDGHRANCKVCKAKSDKDYKLRNKEKVKERLHKYYLAHSDKAKQASKLWQQKNPEKVKEIAKRSRKKNPDTARKAVRKWTKLNPEYKKEWIAKNPLKGAEYNRTRRCKISGSVGRILASEWEELKTQYDHRCLRCGVKENLPDIKLTIDHVVPISVGGDNIIENAQPLCKSCNSSKYTNTVDYRFGLSND